MRKIALYGLLLVSGIGFSQVKVKFEVKNSPSDTLLIGSRTFKKVIVGKAGVFESDLNDATDGFYQIKLKDQYSRLFLEKGTNLIATLDYSDFDKSLKYTGKGSKENNFLAQQLLVDQDELLKDAMNAPDVAGINAEIEKIKSAKINEIPKGVSQNFKTTYTTNLDQEFKGLANYLAQGLEVKKLNGKPSPTFNFENHKGSTTKLEDFKGKYVYIDVWATWCGPCRAEIPYLKTLEQEYHGKNVEFVSISIDQMKDHEKWKKFVTDKQLGGTQLFADKDWSSQFVVDFGIQGIPRFILIDPAGNIVNADAPRPSSPEVNELLSSLVK